ncbi:hypothetical protein D3C86_1647460 [compost metagenome]
MADPVRDLAALLTHERTNGRQIVARIVGDAVLAIVLVAPRQAVTAHFRDPYVEPQARQIRPKAKALGRKPEASIGKAAVQQDHWHATHGRLIGHAQAGDRQLDTRVRTVGRFQTINVFAQIAAPLGADQGDRK